MENHKIDKKKFLKEVEILQDKLKGKVFFFWDTESNVKDAEKFIEDLTRKIASLEDKLIISIIGGTNSGKSTFVNCLFGYEITPTSPEAHFDKVSTIFYPEGYTLPEIFKKGIYQFKEFQEENLRDTIIFMGVDFDSQAGGNPTQVRKIFNLSDVVCLITTEEKYGNASNYELLEEIVQLEKNGILVINKIDRLADFSEAEEIKKHVQEELLPSEIKNYIRVFTVSLKKYFERKGDESGEAEKLLVYLKNDLFLQKNQLKFQDIGSQLILLSREFGKLSQKAREDKEKRDNFLKRLKDLKGEVEESIERIFENAKFDFKKELEANREKIREIEGSWNQKWGLRITSILKKPLAWFSKRRSSETSEREAFIERCKVLTRPSYEVYLQEKFRKLVEEFKVPEGHRPRGVSFEELFPEYGKIYEKVKEDLEREIKGYSQQDDKLDALVLSLVGGLLLFFSSGGFTGGEIAFTSTAAIFTKFLGKLQIDTRFLQMVDKFYDDLMLELKKIFVAPLQTMIEELESEKFYHPDDFYILKGRVDQLRETIEIGSEVE